MPKNIWTIDLPSSQISLMLVAFDLSLKCNID